MSTFLRSSKQSKLITIAVVLFIIIGGGFLLLRKSHSSNNSTTTLGDSTSTSKPLKSADVNREFSFPIFDDSEAEIGKIKYMIERAEIRNEIIVNGQKATAVDGRAFLVLTLKLTNPLDKTIEIKTRDYVRLTRNDSPEQLAPDIHNDPVAVQAISTKYTRVGFAINQSDTKFKLLVGEIKGNKQTIELSL